MGALPEADTAQPELAHYPARSAAYIAASVSAHGELGLAPRLHYQTRLCQTSSSRRSRGIRAAGNDCTFVFPVRSKNLSPLQETRTNGEPDVPPVLFDRRL